MHRYRSASSRARRAQNGSTFVVVLGLIAVLSLLFSAVITRAMNTHRNVSHIATWQEALLAADAGADLAIAEMRRTLFETNAFVGWRQVKPDPNKPNEFVDVGPVPPGASDYILAKLTDGSGLKLVAPKVVHGGEGNTEMESTVVVDAPPELVDPSVKQWFRVRSTGTTYLPGNAHVAGDKRDLRLRKALYRWNEKLQQEVDRPQTSRTVELIVKPVCLEPAIFSRLPINMNNASIMVDSYDSRDPNQSDIGPKGYGIYDPTEATSEGDIATNSQLIDAGNAHIKGDAFTNGGTVLDSGNVTGEISDEYELEVDPITSPSTANPWPAAPSAGGYVPSNMSGGSTVVAGTKDNPKRYKLSGSGSLNITGGNLNFVPDPVEKAAGRESYVQIWVPGDMKTAGTAGITLEPGVYVEIFVEGSIYIGGNGNWNANSQPGRLQVFGVQYTGNGQPPTVTIAGNGIIVAAIYTPDHAVEFKATGSGGQMWGCIFGKSITMGGSTHIHYDRALAESTKITNFRVKSWFEDVR